MLGVAGSQRIPEMLCERIYEVLVFDYLHDWGFHGRPSDAPAVTERFR
jgi:hypothetical protein